MVQKKVPLKNFRVQKLDKGKGEVDAAKQKWGSEYPEFVLSDDLWLATFEIDGETHHAGIMLGRRVDVAEDVEQISVNLRVRDEAFDDDEFLPLWDVADITRCVYEEFAKLALLPSSVDLVSGNK